MTFSDCRFYIPTNNAGDRNASLHSCGDTPIPPVFPNLMDVKFNAAIFHYHNVRWTLSDGTERLVSLHKLKQGFQINWPSVQDIEALAQHQYPFLDRRLYRLVHSIKLQQTFGHNTRSTHCAAALGVYK